MRRMRIVGEAQTEKALKIHSKAFDLYTDIFIFQMQFICNEQASAIPRTDGEAAKCVARRRTQISQKDCARFRYITVQVGIHFFVTDSKREATANSKRANKTSQVSAGVAGPSVRGKLGEACLTARLIVLIPQKIRLHHRGKPTNENFSTCYLE